MILQYAFDEPTNIINVNWENKEFVIEMRTFTDIENFEFNQPVKEISFNVNESNQFITTIIPLELLWGPYAIFLDDEKTYFNDSKNNGTHVWISIKPNAAGEISVIGTTVVPEFPIIAPLAIGFLMIMMIPLIKKLISARTTRAKTIFIYSNITNSTFFTIIYFPWFLTKKLEMIINFNRNFSFLFQ